MIYLTEREAADLLRLAPRTLRKLRHEGGGPRFRKHAARVVYERGDLVVWSESRAFRRTHEPVLRPVRGAGRMNTHRRPGDSPATAPSVPAVISPAIGTDRGEAGSSPCVSAVRPGDTSGLPGPHPTHNDKRLSIPADGSMTGLGVTRTTGGRI